MNSAAKVLSQSADSEQDRLDALDRTEILDTPREEAFDRITQLVRSIFQVPMSTVTFIDGHRQWHKSRQGIEDCETPRRDAICDLAIRGTEPLIIPDTLRDPRVADNPYVIGEPKIRFYAGAPLRTSDGHAIGTLCAMDTVPREFRPEQIAILADLANLVLGELMLRSFAATDPLTGTLMRRAFKHEGKRAMSLALRHHHELSCIALDLDHFKSVNDQYGHAIGDAVLRATAEACRSVLRATDLMGRTGGEEFAILLPHTGAEAAMEVAEKLRAAIGQQRIPIDGGKISVSASFGVATRERLHGDLDVLLDRADAALYQAKANGRNQSLLWQPVAQPHLRRRVFKAGRITFNAGASTIDCTVRGISERDANLDILSSAGIPEHFKLRIEADDFSRLCHVVRKSERSLEVEFQ